MPNDEFADLLRGAQAIADYIGKNYRQTVYLLSTKQIPAEDRHDLVLHQAEDACAPAW